MKVVIGALLVLLGTVILVRAQGTIAYFGPDGKLNKIAPLRLNVTWQPPGNSIRYQVEGQLTPNQRRVWESLLRERFGHASIQRVSSGGNLHLVLRPVPSGGTTVIGLSRVTISIDPFHRSGFATIAAHELRHLREGHFHR